MGQLENNNYYRAGSFRVHGPYHTEKGKDTLEFIAKLIKVEQAEKKLESYAKNPDNKKHIYVQNFGISDDTDLVIVVAYGSFDIGVHDKSTGEFRIDISQSEFDIIQSRIKLYEKKFEVFSDYAKVIQSPELSHKIINDTYFKEYNPVFNPIRGSPPNVKYDYLYDR